MGATGDVWDVAVIGAGPAGATAARVAAAAGSRVIVLERFGLPRYKTCGGGLIDRSLSTLPPELRLPFRAHAVALTFSMRGRLTRTRKAAEPRAADGDEAALVFAGYADTITATLAPEMQAGQAFMRAFKRHPLAMHLALILVPQAWDLFAGVISGRVSIASITKRRLVRVLLAVLST